MALYPSDLPPSKYFRSKAEEIIFRRARESKIINSSEKNYLFHSLRVQNANKKLTGEVDFVFLDSEFILFLEVKGGEVKFDSATNQWWTLGGQKEQDPFEQVCSYLFHIRDKVFPEVFSGRYFDQKLKFGYGVMFPESGKPHGFKKYSKSYQGYTIEYTPEIMYLYNDHNRQYSFDIYLERLKGYWRDYPKYKKFTNGVKEKEVDLIKNYFRTDLIFRIPISEHLNEDADETQYYTEKQTKVLNTVNQNDQFGFIISGGPGTGKSLLALEQAYQKASNDKKVLLLCFNKCLASQLRIQFQKAFPEIHQENVTIIHLHSFLIQTLREHNFDVDIRKPDEFWKVDLPKLFIAAFENYKFSQKFDYLIIDEGQDIFRDNYLNSLSLVLEGGFDSNNWIIFLDREYQTIYEDFDESYFDTFRKIYSAFYLELDVNCRNTPGTVKKAHIHTGLKEMECLKTDRLQPKLIFYKDNNQFLKFLFEIINNLKNDNIALGAITVLTDKDKIEYLTENKPELFDYISNNNCQFPKKKVLLSTPHSFKGLENDFIIYTGKKEFDISNKKDLVEFYIAYTRARTQLYLLFNENIKDSLTRISEQTIDNDIAKKL